MLSDILVQYQCLYFFPALLYSSQNHSRQASSFSSFLPFLVFAFFFYILLLTYLWLCWVFVAVLSCSKQEVLSSYSAWTSHCSGFSCCGAQTLGHVGVSSCSTRARQLWLWNSRAQASSCGSWAQLLCGTWDPSGPGIEPMSPALAGEFFSTEPLGKPCPQLLSASYLLGELVGYFFFLENS